MESEDYPGVEIYPNLKTMTGDDEDEYSSCRSWKSHRRSYSTGDIPPPITPLILRRYYTDDGRLVIRGERMKGREYFHADRSAGRLTLRLIPIRDESDGDGDDSDGDYDNDDNCFEDVESFDHTDDQKETDLAAAESRIAVAVPGGGDDVRESTEKETNMAAAKLSIARSDTVAIPGGGGGGGHLYQYCGMSRSPYLLSGGGIAMAAAAVRSVQT